TCRGRAGADHRGSCRLGGGSGGGGARRRALGGARLVAPHGVMAMERQRYRPHPSHGVELASGAPEGGTVYVEIVPTATVKYEIDKASGYLKVDRPQRFSNVCPTLYGFIPQTYCGTRV